MTDEKVIELAEEAGIDIEGPFIQGSVEELQAFAQLVRNEVLEEAAERCEGLTVDWGDAAEEAGMRQCANEIRGMRS